MDMKLHRIYLITVLGIALSTLTVGCSTVTVEEGTHLPEVPEYVKVPHPVGYEMVDLKAMLLSPLAPKGVLGEFADTCDDEYRKLSVTTVSKEDLKRGAEELVTKDPERLHWCFYAKLSRLQDIVTSDATWSVRQRKVLETYNFLSPVANAYVNIYQDSRYLRWASIYYSKISEWVFFKAVSPGPENTLMMVNTQKTDLEPWVPAKNTGQAMASGSVFEKYGIELAPDTKKKTNPVAEVAPGAVSEQNPDLPKAPEQRAPASVSKTSTPAEAPKTDSAPSQAQPSQNTPAPK